MERFVDKLLRQEDRAEEINSVAGITVVKGMLSVEPEAIQAAYYMKLANEGGPVKNSFPVPLGTLRIAHNYDIDELRTIAGIRGIELDVNE